MRSEGAHAHAGRRSLVDQRCGLARQESIPVLEATGDQYLTEAAGRLPAGETERYWEEGRALDDDAAYALATEEDEART